MNIPLPSRGDDILPWARSITTGVNALGPIGGRGTLVKEAASGFGFEGLPENKRAAKTSSPRNGLFEIESILDTKGYHNENPNDPTKGPFVIYFKNTFFMIAGRMFALEQAEDDMLEEDEEIVFGKVHSKPIDAPCIIGLEIKAGELEEEEEAQDEDDGTPVPIAKLVELAGIEELTARQLDRKYYTIPLYSIDAEGSIVVDFRIGPIAAMWEKGI